MKRITALLFASLLLISLTLCGCSKNESDYVINGGDNITIGVLTSTSSDKDSTSNEILSGITYASQLAHTVNLDKPYEINVKEINFSSKEDIKSAADEFAAENVAAIICEGKDNNTTDTIVSAFSNYSNTPLIFIDNYSNSIADTDNAFSISIPYSYQSSAVVSHLIGEGMSKGAVICSESDKYSKEFARLFENTFMSSGGNSLTKYFYDGKDKNFDANDISAENYEFVFIIGNIDISKQIQTELASAGVSSSIIFSEVFSTNYVEYSEHNGITFISKFERDDNNYIGTDFINTYAKANNVSVSDVTTSVAYGYDAYMTVYDALMSLNSNQSLIFQANDVTESETETDTDIYASDLKEAIKSITHMGVTDTIKFNDKGLTTPAFVYTVRVDNSNAGMLNKYNYSNEQN